MNRGTVKLSTIHSFKGWEIHTLVLIIENDNTSEEGFATEELIYAGITRCRGNLIVINVGNQGYNRGYKRRLAMASSGGRKSNFLWFLGVLSAAPLMPGVRQGLDEWVWRRT
jgi:superfamily I DNA/RNA helicase